MERKGILEWIAQGRTNVQAGHVLVAAMSVVSPPSPELDQNMLGYLEGYLDALSDLETRLNALETP